MPLLPTLLTLQFLLIATHDFLDIPRLHYGSQVLRTIGPKKFLLATAINALFPATSAPSSSPPPSSPPPPSSIPDQRRTCRPPTANHAQDRSAARPVVRIRDHGRSDYGLQRRSHRHPRRTRFGLDKRRHRPGRGRR